MSMPAELTQEPPLGDVEVTTSDVERVERALIDASTRLPVLVFYTSAIAWLLLATILGILTSFKTAFARFSLRPELPHLGPYSPGAFQCADLRLGVDGRDGHRDLAHGAALSHHLAASASAHRGAAFWNLGVLMGIGAIFAGDTHRLRMARISRLLRDHAFCRLPAHHDVGGDHVPLPPARPHLHHAMVFVRRVPLVPVALRRRASDAFHRSGAGRDAGRGQLVVCQQPAFPLVRLDWPRHRLLHDPESNRASGS